ncbi:MAG: Asp-tRNA(Asn)/Glu-tRNA(Gln) amidotransferase subunit GatA [Endomicrobium sp.]|jgi:aspartyl-tRNA(Asn)/glutamyl-tRNA(Gln) amidotransferase subunit A|uniref:Asp-tRNA(Asn)/Glu-tRNA(Gln) amidotransferase subunit GatA n=1 Tax=Candidatus Endomicrobiellum cubanum TaxID=3242325 RepID=UPI0028268F05|nr:Asp-tRNA(Asn)/Glu-tRNA(Gln) amidotransferase subunit GatA [Endomicrobium sp.]
MIRAKEIRTKICSQELKSVDVVKECFSCIKEVNPKVKAFLKLNETSALEQAEQVDKKEIKKYGLLEGVPIAIKDNIMTKGQSMTSASKYLENYVSPYDATVIEKLKEAGAIFVGRTNMDEFAMGGSTETSAYQKTANPWNIECIPGGSSGGSAAAVSAGMVPFALGSDTGGSIRQPAGFCGVVGYKPSYGLISRYGACALASSFDQIGTFTKNVYDAALLTSVIAGKDYRDPVCQPNDWIDYTNGLNDIDVLKTLKIGVPKQLFDYRVDSEITKYFNEAVNKLKMGNVQIVEVDIPVYKYVPALYKVIMCAEVSANIATFDGIRYGYRTSNGVSLNDQYAKSRGESLGYEVKKRILFGTYVLGAKNYHRCYHQAQKVRTLLIDQITQSYEKCDFIFTPATLQMPVKFGETLPEECDLFLIAANLAGLPGITVPWSFTANGMPMGVHFMGARFSDAKLFAVANAFEKIADFDIDKYPTI